MGMRGGERGRRMWEEANQRECIAILTLTVIHKLMRGDG